MKRTVIGFIVGLLTWVIVISLVDRGLRLLIVGYAAAEPALTFTLEMMAARLVMAAVASLIAGAATGAIAPTSKLASSILGVVLLCLFIPVHVKVWHALPLWYHLTFLLTLAPLILLGALLTSRKGISGEPVGAVSS
jgi:hypothetical protein